MHATKKVHWTQRPENREKVLAMNRKANQTVKAKQTKKALITTRLVSNETIIEQLVNLSHKALERLNAIDGEMALLQEEKTQIIHAFGNVSLDRNNHD